MILSDRTARRVRRRIGVLLPWIFAIALAGNIALTLRYLPESAYSLRFAESSALDDVIDSSQATVRRRYGMYAELGRVAGGSTLTIPVNNSLDSSLAEAFGEVEVRVSDYDAALTVDEIGEPSITGEWSVDGNLVRYSIFAGEPGDAYWLGLDGEDAVIVAESVVPMPRGAG